MRSALAAARLMAAAVSSGSAAGPGPQRPRPGAVPLIGTHDGTFHCDEVLACFLLRQLPRYRPQPLAPQDAEVVRTRDPEILAQCDVVVDVGGEYDPERQRYDHHQRSFSESMSSLRPGKPWGTKLSSAGLVYCHLGGQVLAELLGEPEDSPTVTELYDQLYESFVQEIDAIDNGVALGEGQPCRALTTTLSARVGRLNPLWNDPQPDPEGCFQQATALVGGEFLALLGYLRQAWLPARGLLEEAIANRFQVDGSGVVLELPQGGCPWQQHLFRLEQELALPRPLLLLLYPDQAGQWRLQSVPREPGGFQSRLPLPEPWRGLRGQALARRAGIPGCVFVHASGFTGGHQSREGALQMARRTLELQEGAKSG
ncbi:LOW QUALITY PROTEIN: MYG1 exonuclease [Dryobates pubescens]|uniref:LOW QUALITY PROTEIN: MYG1 exonuclease n=1 Tax=Dryobates pubescens TaxID=118200 RepID=UPI0023B9C5D1|nr:LOW QUALITY PROTEIN: MYG1 exonuclease [Dryobates pubescens]